MRRAETHLLGQAADLFARLRQVLVDVGGERLERRDVHDPDFVRQRPIERLEQQLVERDQERGERLARAGRRGDQGIGAGPNRLPPPALGGGGLTDVLGEPFRDEG
jgi:hypothetical protein